MAFGSAPSFGTNPLSKINVGDPYGTTPAARLQRALAGSTFSKKGLLTDYGQGKFDMTKGYKKQVPRTSAQFASRGLETSGLKNMALAEQAAAFDRQRAESRGALDRALFNLAVENLGEYGGYSGSRFEDVMGASSGRAERAAQIREALA